MQTLAPPKENLEIFAILYQIETALRELIIEVLTNAEGSKWYKKCLPNDILDKYRRSRDLEKHTHWTQFVPLHPIYYVDFPDLKKIIERDDNWKKAFERIFVRKDILSGILSVIEPIRNKIAHNRKATTTDVEIVKGVLSELSTAIGSNYFDSLLRRCTFAVSIPEQFIQLQNEAKSALSSCSKYEHLDDLKIWSSVRDTWWFDESYLGEKINKIIEFFQIVEEYSHLPRLRGSGHKIENWVRNSDIARKYADAAIQLEAILANI